MRSYTKAALAVAILAAAVAVAVTSASAARLSFRTSTGTKAWRATWSAMSFAGGFGTTSCTLTLEGSFHSSTFAKTRSSLVGFVTEARTGGCTTFNATLLRENLPWHVQYEAFSGILPNINTAALKIIGFEFRIAERAFGVACLFRSTEAAPLRETLTREAGGVITSATLGGSITTDCGIASTFGGSSTSFGTPPPPPPPATTITLSLI
jgi:hypothetical protein